MPSRTAPQIEVPALLVRLPHTFRPGMRGAQLREIALGWWRVGPRRNGVEYVFAVHGGVVVDVFKVDRKKGWRRRKKGDRDWQHDKGKRPRWGCSGATDRALRTKYKGRSVVGQFKPGARNPILYRNC